METPTEDLNLCNKKITAIYSGTIMSLCAIFSKSPVNVLSYLHNLKIILKKQKKEN